MKDTPKIQTLNAKIQTLSELVNRANLSSKMGMQYGTDRNIYQALGYPANTDLTYQRYYDNYLRYDIAKTIIDKPISMTWKGNLSIVEPDNDNETVLEKAFDELNERLKLKSKFVQLDKLTSLGNYGILLLGLDDVKSKEDWIKPVNTGKRKLFYIKPLGQGCTEISKWETDTNNPRYGLPLNYSITLKEADTSSQTIVVHYSRIIHVVQNPLDSEVTGTPVLESVFNRLMDLEKLVGGSAEMFWRGARPGYQALIDEKFQVTDATEDDLINQLDEYENNLRRILVNEGITLKGLETQISNPKDHVDIQIQMISAVTGIPKRILTGSERGELSSTQDDESWLTVIQMRRDDYAEPNIVRAFVDTCITYGILPSAVDSYDVDWSDLFQKSEEDKVKVGLIRSQALKEYTSNPMAESIVPPEAFFEYMLGFEQEDIDLIKEMADAQVIDEPPVTPEEETIIDKNV